MQNDALQDASKQNYRDWKDISSCFRLISDTLRNSKLLLAKYYLNLYQELDIRSCSS